MKKPWWKQGRIGGILTAMREDEVSVQAIDRTGWILIIPGRGYIHLTLRGNSKQRRQQRRAVLRYIQGN